MLNLELRAEFCDHSINRIGTIFSDDPFKDAIPIDKVVFNEPSHNTLGNRSKRVCFNPLSEVINRYQDGMMPIRSNRLNFYKIISMPPHCKRPRSSQDIKMNQRHMYFVSINLAFMESFGMMMVISFHGRPI